MSDNPSTTRNRETLLENVAAEITSVAYAVALRHGVEEKWLDLELELWKSLKETVKQWEQGLPDFSDVPFVCDWAKSEGVPGVRDTLGHCGNHACTSKEDQNHESDETGEQ